MRAADSIVLERTSGFSVRPAYRVSVARSGKISFARRQGARADSLGPRVAADSVAPILMKQLLLRAEHSGFFRMPPEIRQDSVLCPIWRTDAASVVVAVYGVPRRRRVDIYEGCVQRSNHGHVARVQAILDLADAIDEVAGTARWLGNQTAR